MGLFGGSSTDINITTQPVGPGAQAAESVIGGAVGNQQAANAGLAQLLGGGNGLNDPVLAQLREALTQQVNQQFFGPGGVSQQGNLARQQAGAFSSSGANNILDRLAQTYTQSLGNALAGPQFEYQNAAQNRLLQALGLQTQQALGGAGLYQNKSGTVNQQTQGGLGDILGAAGIGLGALFGEGGLIPGLSGLGGGGGGSSDAFDFDPAFSPFASNPYGNRPQLGDNFNPNPAPVFSLRG